MIFFFSWCGLFCRKMLVNSKSSMIVCSHNGFFIATRRVHFVSVIVDITNSYRIIFSPYGISADVRTQAMYQLLDSGFIGLIFSCFSEDAQKVFVDKIFSPVEINFPQFFSYN